MFYFYSEDNNFGNKIFSVDTNICNEQLKNDIYELMEEQNYIIHYPKKIYKYNIIDNDDLDKIKDYPFLKIEGKRVEINNINIPIKEIKNNKYPCITLTKKNDPILCGRYASVISYMDITKIESSFISLASGEYPSIYNKDDANILVTKELTNNTIFKENKYDLDKIQDIYVDYLKDINIRYFDFDFDKNNIEYYMKKFNMKFLYVLKQ